MTADHRELAETFLAMLNSHDPDAVDRFVAVGYINHNAFVGDGREANRAFWAAFFAAFPDLTASMDDLVIAGDRVVGRFTYRGTHRGPLFGIPPTGRPRCAPSTSGASPAASSPSTGTSSTTWSSSSSSA